MRSPHMRYEILTVIREYIREHGYGPTVREIGEAVGLRSTASVYYHLRQLAEDGEILCSERQKRSISLPVRAEPNEVPLIGVIAAGKPILAQENVEGYLHWDGALGWYGLRVKGDSMINAGILNGDIVVVRPQSTAENGEIVVALIDDSATVKRFYKENGHVRLQPENDEMDPIIVPDCRILGKVIALIRTFR